MTAFFTVEVGLFSLYILVGERILVAALWTSDVHDTGLF